MNKMEKILLVIAIYLFSQELFGLNLFVSKEEAYPYCKAVLKKHFSETTIAQLKELLAPRQINENSFCLISIHACNTTDTNKECWIRLGVTIPVKEGRRPPQLFHFYVEKNSGRISKEDPKKEKVEVLDTETQVEDSHY